MLSHFVGSPRARRIGYALFTIFWFASLTIAVAAPLAGT